VKLEAEYLSSGQAGWDAPWRGRKFRKQNQGYGMGTRMSY
jgi:hypothetical protein